ADEFSFERVRPAVILAAHDIFAAAAEGDGPGAMAANVAERAKSSLLVADDENGLAGDFSGEISFGIGDGFHCTIYLTAGLHRGSDELPGLTKNLFLLNFEDSRVGVKARGEGKGALDLFVHVEVKRFGCAHSKYSSAG